MAATKEQQYLASEYYSPDISKFVHKRLQALTNDCMRLEVPFTEVSTLAYFSLKVKRAGHPVIPAYVYGMPPTFKKELYLGCKIEINTINGVYIVVGNKLMKIERHKKNSSENESLFIVKGDDFEYVNPLVKFKEQVNTVKYLLCQVAIESNPEKFRGDIVKKVIEREVEKDWAVKRKELKSTKFPSELEKLLQTNKKREQIKLLKGMTLKSSELNAFIVFAYEEFGYLYSMYKRQMKPKGYQDGQIPMAMINDSEEIERYSDSDLTDGQIKQLIEHQKFHVARFLDLEDSWHCFFYTIKSLKGKELHFRDDRPHLHYISSAWTMSRADVLKKIMSEKYGFKSTPHIDFVRYE